MEQLDAGANVAFAECPVQLARQLSVFRTHLMDLSAGAMPLLVGFDQTPAARRTEGCISIQSSHRCLLGVVAPTDDAQRDIDVVHKVTCNAGASALGSAEGL